MEYFVFTDRQEGPFSLEQMQNKQLTVDTPVWHTGLTEWTTAGNVSALSQFIKTIPPPYKTIPPSYQAEQTNDYEYQLQMEEFFTEKKGIDKGTLAWVIFSVCCLLFLVWAMNK